MCVPIADSRFVLYFIRYISLTDTHDKKKGCNQGKKCTEFHPKMCPASMTKGKCTDLKCRFMHVKGTCKIDSDQKDDTDASDKLKPYLAH